MEVKGQAQKGNGRNRRKIGKRWTQVGEGTAAVNERCHPATATCPSQCKKCRTETASASSLNPWCCQDLLSAPATVAHTPHARPLQPCWAAGQTLPAQSLSTRSPRQQSRQVQHYKHGNAQRSQTQQQCLIAAINKCSVPRFAVMSSLHALPAQRHDCIGRFPTCTPVRSKSCDKLVPTNMPTTTMAHNNRCNAVARAAHTNWGSACVPTTWHTQLHPARSALPF